jgi:methylenetetrahydrofolate reductase (NADPH)
VKSGSNIERLFDKGEFVVTGEIGPPMSSDPSSIREHARHLKGFADAFNLTDNQTAIVRMSSLASSVICLQEGVEPIMQMTCRDRNRIAMQSDLLGASALGIRNLLCLSGDHQTFGNQAESKNVYDLDSIQQLMMLRRMRDESKVWGDTDIKEAPKVFLGAAANPFADPFEFRVTRLAKKVKAGADFIQTQAIFDMERFECYMREVRSRKLHEEVHIMAGVVPLKSLGAARYMKNKVSGMIVPDQLIDRMKDAEDPKEEGISICVEQIQNLMTIEGVHGVHIMPVAWEKKLPEIVERAGLLPRPVL